MTSPREPDDKKHLVLSAEQAAIIAYFLSIAMRSPASHVISEPARTDAVNAFLVQAGGHPYDRADLALASPKAVERRGQS